MSAGAFLNITGDWPAAGRAALAGGRHDAARACGSTTIHAMSGRQYTVDARGCVTVTADDAEPLMCSGWQRVELAQDALASTG